MRLADRITTLWCLLCERSPEGRRRRGRLGAACGLAFLAAGFLTAVGLGELVAIALAAVALAIVLAAGIVAAPHFWPALSASLRSGWIHEASVRCSRAGHAMAKLPRPVLARTRAGTSRVLRITTSALSAAQARIPRERARQVRRAFGAQSRAGTRRIRQLSSSATAGVRASLGRLLAARSGSGSGSLRQLESARRPAVGALRSPETVAAPIIDRRGEALGLNAAGVRLRRDGSPAEAAAQHRAALEILRELDDDRSVALTLNNLALALSHDGDDAVAVELFQEAAAILAELGDEQHEGQVIANLGLAHRRHGRGEEADNVLQRALAKLAPASSAYRTVEAELRRAS